MKCAQGPTYLFIKTRFTNTMQLKTHSLHHFKGGLFLVKKPENSTEIPGPPFPFHI